MLKNSIFSIFLVSFIFSSIVSADITNDCVGVVGLYHFEGSASDDSGNVNHGSVVGAVSAGGRFNNAYSFNGNEYITINDSKSLDITGAITVSIWIKPSTTGSGSRHPLRKNGNTTTEYFMEITSADKLRAKIQDVGDLTSIRSVQKGKWQHIAFTYDKTNMRIYLNGVEEISAPSTSNILGSSQPLIIGGRINSGPADMFVGEIDEVIIYNKSLSSSEILLLNNTASPVSCGPPECSDGIDNDGDGKTDYSGGDTGCTDNNDNDETNCGDNTCETGIELCDVCIADCGTCPVLNCIDADVDGYINTSISDAGCTQQHDCNENDNSINPGATEGPNGNPTCSDGKDNDCDGYTDSADSNCQQISGNIYYVSLSGSDSNACTGTESNACRTVEGAIGKASDGDTIKIEPGNYNIASRIYIDGFDGLTITAENPSNKPVLTKTTEGFFRIGLNSVSNNVEISNIVLDNGNRRCNYWYGIIRIDGGNGHYIHDNEIRDGWIAVEIRGGHSHRVINNMIHDLGEQLSCSGCSNGEDCDGGGVVIATNGGSGWPERMYIAGNTIYNVGDGHLSQHDTGVYYVELYNNTIHDTMEDCFDLKWPHYHKIHGNTCYNNYGDGLVSHSGQPGSDVEIYNNVFHDFAWWGIYIEGLSNVDVYNNIVYGGADCTDGTCDDWAANGMLPCSGSGNPPSCYNPSGGNGAASWYHNVFYNNGCVTDNTGGDMWHASNSNVGGTVKNNVFFQDCINNANWGNFHGGGNYNYNYFCYAFVGTCDSDNGVDGDTQANRIGTSSSIDPGFANEAYYVFTLEPASILIDAGVGGLGITKDFLGNSRIGNPDLGAYEFGGTPIPCTDGDTDGYDSSSCGGNDCDDTDPNVNPGMNEVIGNGKDDDCDPSTPDSIQSRDAFSRIEAESYDAMSGIQTESCSEGGQDIGFIEDGDYSVYNDVDFGIGAVEFEARTASDRNGGDIEIRLDSSTGTLVGTCQIPVTGGWQAWSTQRCSISTVTGVHDLYLHYKNSGTSDYLFNLNWVKFNNYSIPSGTQITVDASQKYQTIHGTELTVLGDQFSATEYAKPHQELADELVHDFGFNYIKFRFDLDNFEPVNDNADPLTFNTAAYDNAIASSQYYQNVFSMIKKFHDNGAKIHLSAWWAPTWMRVPTSGQSNRYSLNSSYSRPELYLEIAELWAAVLVQLRDNYDVEVESIVLWNEPTDVWSPFRFTKNEEKETIKYMGQRFVQENLNPSIYAGDDGYITTNIDVAQTVLNDPLVAPYVGGIAYHTYDNFDRTNPDSFINELQTLAADTIILNSGLPLRMTEWAPEVSASQMSGQALVWTKLMYNTHIYGRTSVFDVWGLMPIGVWGNPANDIRSSLSGLVPPAYTVFKWEKLAYAMKQYAKYIEPGSQMIDVSLKAGTSISTPAVSAYLHPTSERLTIVAMNRDTSSKDVVMTLNSLSGYSSLETYQTSASKDAESLGQEQVTNGYIQYTLPPESITTFTGSKTQQSCPDRDGDNYFDKYCTNIPSDDCNDYDPIRQDCHAADTSTNGCVDNTELLSFVDAWKAKGTMITMPQLIGAIKIWKACS